MLAVLITLTPGRRKQFIGCQQARVPIVVLPSKDVKPGWKSTLLLIERASRLWEFTHEWLQKPKSSEYQPLLSTQDETTIVKYVMEVSRPFHYWTLWISKRHKVTLHHIITVSTDTFNHIDVVVGAAANKRTCWVEDLYFAVKLAW